jgi:hypothetical protein
VGERREGVRKREKGVKGKERSLAWQLMRRCRNRNSSSVNSSRLTAVGCWNPTPHPNHHRIPQPCCEAAAAAVEAPLLRAPLIAHVFFAAAPTHPHTHLNTHPNPRPHPNPRHPNPYPNPRPRPRPHPTLRHTASMLVQNAIRVAIPTLSTSPHL